MRAPRTIRAMSEGRFRGREAIALDLVGIAGLAAFLIGLTNKAATHLVNGVAVGNDWGDLSVGGLMLVGLALAAVFILIESRVPEPIVPLGLFRIRNFTISVAAMFLAAFGFFGAIIFLPRWFQTVAGTSATESGYSILPLLVGLIFSATASGQIVARTGRYKLLIVVSLVLLAGGLLLVAEVRREQAALVAGRRHERDGVAAGEPGQVAHVHEVRDQKAVEVALLEHFDDPLGPCHGRGLGHPSSFPTISRASRKRSAASASNASKWPEVWFSTSTAAPKGASPGGTSQA